MVPIERSCHKEYTYEIPITYHSKDMANVKVFADRQTKRRTGQKLYALNRLIRGHKKMFNDVGQRRVKTSPMKWLESS
jgi:hypothetical protein